MKVRLYIIILFFSCFSNESNAQISIKEKIYSANQLFEAGKINEAINLANECLTTDDKSELWQTNHLLALAYIAQGEEEKARQCAENMMEINPTYVPSSLSDPLELIKLLNGVTILPKFSLGLSATIGGNRSFPKVFKSYFAANYTKKYRPKNSWEIGVMGGYTLNHKLSVNSGFIVSNKKYEIDYTVDNIHNINVEENNNYFDIPLYISFLNAPNSNLRLSLDVGIYGGYLVSTHTNFSVESNFGDSLVQTTVYEKLYAKNRKTNFEYGALIGGSISKKLGVINVALSTKYYKSLFYNITDVENRPNSNDLLYNFYYIDDDLRLDNLSISLSMSYDINYQVFRTTQ